MPLGYDFPSIASEILNFSFTAAKLLLFAVKTYLKVRKNALF